MEPGDEYVIPDPYYLKVKVGDSVLLPGGRMAVVTEYQKLGGWPYIRIHVFEGFWASLIRRLSGTDWYFDRDINDLTPMKDLPLRHD